MPETPTVPERHGDNAVEHFKSFIRTVCTALSEDGKFLSVPIDMDDDRMEDLLQWLYGNGLDSSWELKNPIAFNYCEVEPKMGVNSLLMPAEVSGIDIVLSSAYDSVAINVARERQLSAKTLRFDQFVGVRVLGKGMQYFKDTHVYLVDPETDAERPLFGRRTVKNVDPAAAVGFCNGIYLGLKIAFPDIL